jgi:hypothetical protein
MGKTTDAEAAQLLEECLASLPDIPLELDKKGRDDGLERAELSQSLLAVTDLDHVSETALVRTVVEKALGRLPEFEE